MGGFPIGIAVAPNPTDWGAPVAGATVRGSFAPGGTARCVTDSSGVCSLTSATIDKNTSLTQFTVTSVAGPLMNYDATKNVATEIWIPK